MSESTRSADPYDDYGSQVGDPAHGGGAASTRDVAADQARSVAGDAQEAGSRVAGTARDQAAQVADEAKTQARRLYDDARSELTDQAASQGQRAARGLHSLADELEQMNAATPADAYTSQLVGPAAQKSRDLARWLENRAPGDVVQEVADFARRRPGTFLLAAAAAGLVAGRLSRGLMADHADDSTGNDSDALASGDASGYPARSHDVDPSGTAYSSAGGAPAHRVDPVDGSMGGLGTVDPASYDAPGGVPLTAQDPHAGETEGGWR